MYLSIHYQELIRKEHPSPRHHCHVGSGIMVLKYLKPTMEYRSDHIDKGKAITESHMYHDAQPHREHTLSIPPRARI